jgi:hypothetical protein
MMTRRNNEKTLKSRQRNEDLSKQWNYEMLLYEAKLEDISFQRVFSEALA